MAQADWISSVLIVNGGAILIESSQCKNQSTISPFSIHSSITFLLNSKSFNWTASINPCPLTPIISECISNVLNKFPFSIRHGERIAQMVICKLPDVDVKEVTEFTKANKSSRSGGLGSTGK